MLPRSSGDGSFAEGSQHPRAVATYKPRPLHGAPSSGTFNSCEICYLRFMCPLVSILINNYNYARFLPKAIESALSQTYCPIEIIVVDDGSSDQSRLLISTYENLIIPILKENGGQASAFNAGIARSQGSIICFLDSDDYFHPTKVQEVVTLFETLAITKPLMIHHPLQILDEASAALTGELIGESHVSPLNLYDFARRFHFVGYHASPTTGISLNRSLVDLLFPLPEEGVRVSADDFIVKGASLVGQLYSLNRPLGVYRAHGENAWFYSSRRKSREFMEILDTYLNKKLLQTSRAPVVSFRHSMDYWSVLALERKWLELIWSIVSLSILQRSPDMTIRHIRKIRRLIMRRSRK
jgi:glycosyltransferase involved in cell wall biosynthesis